MVQWLRLHAPNEGDAGSIPGWGTKIPRATQCSQNQTKTKTNKQIEKKKQNTQHSEVLEVKSPTYELRVGWTRSALEQG